MNRGTWAITGAEGYVGRQLCRHLNGCGIRTRELTRSRPEVFRDSANTFVGDLTRFESLLPFLQGADVVVHLAAYVHRRAATPIQKRECYAVNVDGTANLIRAMQLVCPQAFLVFISSINVYQESVSMLSESSPTGPRTYYGNTKLQAEKLVLSAVSNNEISATILRPAAVIGSGAPGNLGRLIRYARRGIVVQIGPADNRKTLLPVQALIQAIRAVVDEPRCASGEIFNVAGGDPVAMRTILNVVTELTPGSKRVILPRLPFSILLALSRPLSRWLPAPLEGLRQSLETYLSSAAITDTKLRLKTPYAFSVDPLESLRDTVREISLN